LFSFKQDTQIEAFKEIGIANQDSYFKYETKKGKTEVAWFNRGHLTPNGDFDQGAQKVRGHSQLTSQSWEEF